MTRLLTSLSLCLIVLLLCAPLVAQDATREATSAPTAEATSEAPVIINIEGDAAPVTSDGSLWGYVLVIGGVIVSGFVGVSFVLQGIGNRAAAAAANPLEIAVIEKGFDSIPSAVLNGLVKPLQESLERSDAALKQVLILLSKATDKIPEASKPVPPTDEYVTTATHDLSSPATQAPTEG
jgi:hypothetical protein